MSLLDNMAINAKVRMWKVREKAKDFLAEEKGVSNVVATIIMIMIVVLLISLFWEKLSEWVGDLMDQITGSTVNGGDSLDIPKNH